VKYQRISRVGCFLDEGAIYDKEVISGEKECLGTRVFAVEEYEELPKMVKKGDCCERHQLGGSKYRVGSVEFICLVLGISLSLPPFGERGSTLHS